MAGGDLKDFARRLPLSDEACAARSSSFAVFYAICVVLNWWFYLRKDDELRLDLA